MPAKNACLTAILDKVLTLTFSSTRESKIFFFFILNGKTFHEIFKSKYSKGHCIVDSLCVRWKREEKISIFKGQNDHGVGEE